MRIVGDSAVRLEREGSEGGREGERGAHRWRNDLPTCRRASTRAASRRTAAHASERCLRRRDEVSGGNSTAATKLEGDRGGRTGVARTDGDQRRVGVGACALAVGHRGLLVEAALIESPLVDGAAVAEGHAPAHALLEALVALGECGCVECELGSCEDRSGGRGEGEDEGDEREVHG